MNLRLVGVAVSLVAFSTCTLAAATDPPYDLRTEMLAAPTMGVDTASPKLAWSLDSPVRGTVSTGYQVQLQRVSNVATTRPGAPAWNASAAVLWDTGKVEHCHRFPEDGLCVPESHAVYTGPALASATAYQWRVRWWSNATSTPNAPPSEYSAPAIFLTGLFEASDWRDAAFLTCANGTAPATPPPPPPPAGSPFWPVVGPPQCRHLRTSFTLARTPVRATAYITAMGYAELWINGQKAGGNAVLEPGWTQYDRRLIYATYDVTDLVACPQSEMGRNTDDLTQLCVKGDQTAGVMLGNGWPGHLGHTPTFKLLIKFEYSVTSPTYVTSNAVNWTASWQGPILLDDIYGGETYDARLEIPGFGSCPDAQSGSASCSQLGPLPGAVDAMAFEDPSTMHAVLSSQMMQPIRALQLLPATEIMTPHHGIRVVDFGQNIAGWGRLALKKCPVGLQLKLSFAEVLHQTTHADIKCSGSGSAEDAASGLLDPLHNCTWVKGMVNMQYLMCTPGHGSVTGDRCAYDLYTCKGGAEEVYEPRFTYHGFRYVQIEGLPDENSPTWALEARVVHSDVESSSSLSFGGANSASLNQLQSNLEWTQRDNLHSVPTDCNQRTERQGWMADASVSAETAHHNFDMKPFYRNWLRSIVDVQQDFPSADPLDHRSCGSQGRSDCVGAVTDTVPHPPGTFGTRPADPSWSSSFDLTYWYLVRYSGDKRIANETYPALKSYIDYMLSIAAKDSSGLLRWGTTFDWLEQQWPTGDSNYHVKIRNDMTSAFNTILGVKILVDAATLLDRDADAVHYGGIVKDQLERWHTTFYNTTETGGVSEAFGRFIHPAQEPGSKICPNGGICCPLPQFPGGCTFWEACPHAGVCSSPDDRLHMVSNCDAYPASCGPAQKPCWPNVERGLTIHPVNASYLKSVKLADNFTCDMPTKGSLVPTDTTYGDGSQSVPTPSQMQLNVLAYTLFLNAAPTQKIRDATLAQLVAAIKKTDNHPTTGIIGTKWLPEALSKLGRPDVVLDMVLQTGAPSWMDQIEHNATTVWENWEYFVGPNMNSHNHPALTSIGAWMWRWFAGIRIAEEPSEPGYASAYSHVTIAPYEKIATDHTRISSATANLPTTHGDIALAWAFTDNKLVLNMTLPVNTLATVKLPSSAGRGWLELSEGGAVLYEANSRLRGGNGTANGNSLAGGVFRIAATDEDHVEVTIGSGSYHFVATLGPDSSL